MLDNHLPQIITHLRNGKRAEARKLLFPLIEKYGQNENLWVLMSAAVEEPEDQIIALGNVLTLNPQNNKAKKRLSKLLIKKGITAVKSGQLEEGSMQLKQALEYNPRSASAWLWLSRAAVDIDERINALRPVIHLKPDYKPAAEELEELLAIGSDLFKQASYYTKKRDYERAAAVYQKIIIHDEENRGRAEQKLKRLHQREREEEIAPPVPDGITLARLTVGPPLFYNMMLFIHAGLNPLHVAPILFMAGGLVLFGSFLMVGTQYTPDYTLWRSIFGRRGLQPSLRVGLWATGLLCAILPFLLVLTAAYQQYTLTINQLPFVP